MARPFLLRHPTALICAITRQSQRTCSFCYITPQWRSSNCQRLSTLPSRSESSIQTQSTSLIPAQLYDQSPVSVGIYTFDGYLELIGPRRELPHTQIEHLESALDYIRQTTFSICYRLSVFHTPVEIQKAELQGIRFAKKADTRVKVFMTMEKDLKGLFVAQDVFTKRKVSVNFDGKLAIQERASDNAVIAI